MKRAMKATSKGDNSPINQVGGNQINVERIAMPRASDKEEALKFQPPSTMLSLKEIQLKDAIGDSVKKHHKKLGIDLGKFLENYYNAYCSYPNGSIKLFCQNYFGAMRPIVEAVRQREELWREIPEPENLAKLKVLINEIYKLRQKDKKKLHDKLLDFQELLSEIITQNIEGLSPIK